MKQSEGAKYAKDEGHHPTNGEKTASGENKAYIGRNRLARLPHLPGARQHSRKCIRGLDPRRTRTPRTNQKASPQARPKISRCLTCAHSSFLKERLVELGVYPNPSAYHYGNFLMRAPTLSIAPLPATSSRSCGCHRGQTPRCRPLAIPRRPSPNRSRFLDPRHRPLQSGIPVSAPSACV